MFATERLITSLRDHRNKSFLYKVDDNLICMPIVFWYDTIIMLVYISVTRTEFAEL